MDNFNKSFTILFSDKLQKGLNKIFAFAKVTVKAAYFYYSHYSCNNTLK